MKQRVSTLWKFTRNDHASARYFRLTKSTESSTDNLTNAQECPICHKLGFHKLSCPTQKVTVFLSDVKVEGVTAESEGVSGKQTCGFCVEPKKKEG